MPRSTREQQAEQTIDQIYRLLREAGLHTANLAFEALLGDLLIAARYRKSEQFSERTFINRHDRTHALRTTLSAVHLFLPLAREPSLFRTAKDPTGRDPYGFDIMRSCRLFRVKETVAQDFACACIVVAAFCHDMYKFLGSIHDQATAMAIENVARRILQPLLDLSIAEIGLEMFLPTIESVVFRHGGGKDALSAEEGIVMIADLVDNDEERIREAQILDVVTLDDNPIEYFSCLGIKHPVQIAGSRTKLLDIAFDLQSDAGWLHVREMFDTIKSSGLADLISLRARPPRHKKWLALL